MTKPIAVLIAAAAAVAATGALGVAAQAKTTTRAKLQLRSGELGRFLVDGHGRTLYLFERDRRGRSACSGSCAKAWPPLLTTGRATAGRGVSAKRIGSYKRRDGSTQVTYNGHPLYRFASDTAAGQAKGEGVDAFGAEWYVLSSGGRKIEGTEDKPPSATSPSTPSGGDDPYGYGNGY
jgi:predicted lipoprotein with Yx(FWY)xxD motif